jgi:hypothetical protein
MAKRTIQSPGVEIKEIDLSLRLPSPAGTTIYATGFADQGPTDEVVGVSSFPEFEQIYGTPKTPAERYFYYTVKAAFNSTGRVLVNRLPYGLSAGTGFGPTVSLLAFPGATVTRTAFSAVTGAAVDYGYNPVTTFDTSSVANLSSTTYLIGAPTQFNITTAEYLRLLNGTLFTWSPVCSANNNGIFTGLSTLSSAALIIVNKAQTVIDGRYTGYYTALADNTNINPASDYDGTLNAFTVTQSAPIAGLAAANFTKIPQSRLLFALSATAGSGTNPAVGSISQIMEEKIVGYNTGTREFDDTLNLGIFKLRQSVFSPDANQLDYVLEESFNGSIGANRQINSETGGAPVNFYIGNAGDSSRNVDILVNPYIADAFIGVQLNSDGSPKKKVRVISNQLRSTVYAANTSNAIDVYSITGTSSAALQTVLSGIGYADSLYPVGAFSQANVKQKLIGSIPLKIDRALSRIRNPDLFDIDIIAEGGLGTIYTYLQTQTNVALSAYFDDLQTTPGITALGTSGDLTSQTGVAARDAYNTIFSQFATFAGPVKDGGRGDLIFIADPIRQTLVTGKDNKTINDPSKTFSTDIYWALRHQFSFANTSYATTYANYLKVFDSYSGTNVYVPSSGYAAAKMVTTDVEVGPWGAPAGFNRGIVTDAIDVAFSPNQRQRDDLYTISLNPITTFPDQGIVVFGQKTLLKKPSAFDRINVRRNFLYLEKATKSVMKFFLFENNTFFTRTRVANTLIPFFERVKAAGGLYDYLIVCDERNNTAEVIDNNELVVDIYLKPVRTVEFIQVNFYATRTDTRFEELIGG